MTSACGGGGEEALVQSAKKQFKEASQVRYFKNRSRVNNIYS